MANIMQTSVVPQERFSAIEGLRGYMALWVLAAHCLGAAGYELDQLHGVIKMIRDADYAVDVFVIVSGFVISRLIIKSRERYIVFIGRRFFRLFPLYALCMVVGAMLTNLLIWNLNASGEWITEQSLHSELHIITSIFQNFWENVALCTLMLQGVLPQSIVPYAPIAFLGTAWSISLEWQFYLIAPLLVPSLLGNNGRTTLIISWLTVFALFVLAQLKWLPQVVHGAFLPCHIEFFLIGIASYGMLLKLTSPRVGGSTEARSITHLVFGALTISFLLFPLAAGTRPLLPYLIWLVVVSLLVQKQVGMPDIFTRLLDWVLSSRIVLFLGEISYGIYLVHLIAIYLIQGLLFLAFPELGQMGHFLALLLLVSLLTVALSTVLHYAIEKPAIRFARKLFTPRPATSEFR